MYVHDYRCQVVKYDSLRVRFLLRFSPSFHSIYIVNRMFLIPLEKHTYTHIQKQVFVLSTNIALAAYFLEEARIQRKELG